MKRLRDTNRFIITTKKLNEIIDCDLSSPKFKGKAHSDKSIKKILRRHRFY